jgi:hypothetical protein
MSEIASASAGLRIGEATGDIKGQQRYSRPTWLSRNRFTVVELPNLKWPTSLQLPGSRFRLFVAADRRDGNDNAVSEFVSAALQQDMVYCCVWGPGCERFHDIIDDVVVEEGLSERRFVGATPNDVIMTT